MARSGMSAGRVGCPARRRLGRKPRLHGYSLVTPWRSRWLFTRHGCAGRSRPGYRFAHPGCALLHGAAESYSSSDEFGAISLLQPPQPPVREHAQADRRHEPNADGERLLQYRMPRVKRRDEEHAEERRDAEVVPERRSQLHLLIVNEIRHDEGPPAGSRLILRRRRSRHLEG